MRFFRKRTAKPPASTPPRDVEIREEVIRLGQLLKLADLADDGTEAKALLAEGVVLVDGVVEQRRGRQVVRGSVVRCYDEEVRVV